MWRIIRMSEWDDDYVNEEVKAFVKIEKSGIGEFHFGFVHGFICGELKKDKENMIFDFMWEGNDECDSVNGDGWLKMTDNNHAEGKIRFHGGDVSKFWVKKKYEHYRTD